VNIIRSWKERFASLFGYGAPAQGTKEQHFEASAEQILSALLQMTVSNTRGQGF
jgi:hypothetical protein